MKQFSDLGLAEPLLRAVSAEGYTNPTPIQAAVIPAMLGGADILATAQTGTGKTASFVLPLLQAVAAGTRRPARTGCHALILVPTRELAAQVADSIRAYGRFTRPTAAVIVGGAKPAPQIRALARGVDIVVATPGRLEDHLSTGAVRLDGTAAVILDEADQMLDLGFMPAIRRILAKLPAARQTVLLSATMPKPIRDLAHGFLTDPAQIAVAPVSRPVERIDQTVIPVADAAAKRPALVGLLAGAEVERAIVFTRTKHGADKVCRHLETAGIAAAAIHGNKSQNQRERTLAAFRSGQVRILVATDIAARGIDVDDVSHVVNFDLPNVPEAYVHRIGRTARAGKSGIAVSLCAPAERGLLKDIERLIGRALARVEGAATTEAAAPSPPPDARPAAPARPGRRRRSKAPDQRRKAAGAKPAGHRRSGAEAPSAGLARMLTNGSTTQRKPAAAVKA